MKFYLKIFFVSIMTISLVKIGFSANSDNPAVNSNTLSFIGVGSTSSPEIIVGNTFPLEIFLEEYDQLDQLNHKIDKAKLSFMLDLGDIYKLGINEFSVDLSLRIYKNSASGPVVQDVEFKISNENPRQLIEIPYTSLVTSSTPISDLFVEVIDYDILPSTINADVLNLVQRDLRLMINTLITYKIDVKDVGLSNVKPITTNVIQTAFNSSTGNMIDKRIVKFEWETPSPLNLNFPFYEFELLKIEPNSYENNTEKDYFVDWDNALKLVTASGQKELTITIGEGSGFYLWRVRPLGTFYSGNLSFQNKGEWSNFQNDKSYIDINISTSPTANSFKFKDPDEEKNWIYSRVIAENNKIGEQMAYGNGFGQTVQTQTNMNESGFTLISQGIKDFNGRTTLTTLPVPISGGLDNYVEKFVMNADNELYTADDFDTDINIDNPSPLNFPTLNDYYNGTNDIPDDGGYPYSRTIFYKNGDLKEQSGVGSQHHIGTDKTTLTWFGQPSPAELIRIFGNEAPNPETILKTFVKDPNGTVSLSYTSMQGKVLATALASSDNTLEDVGSESSAQFDVVYNINDNVEIPNGFSSSKVLVFPEETTINIDYTLDPNGGNNSINDNDCVVLGECSFTITIEILDVLTGELYSKTISSSDDDTNDINDLIGSDGSTINNDGTNIILPAGTYQFKKTVQLTNPGNISDDIDQAAINVQAGIEPVISLITEWISQVVGEPSLDEFYLKVNNTYILDATNSIDQEVIDIINGGVVVDLETPCTSSPCPYTNIIRILNAPCCDDFEIPFQYKPPTKCFSPAELITLYNNDPYIRDSLGFEVYLEDRLMSTYTQNVLDDPILTEANLILDWERLLPGYQRYSGTRTMTDPTDPSGTIPNVLGDFDRMLFHMLTDQYSCESNAPAGSEIFQYECKDIWECWLAAINIIEPVLAEIAALNDQSGPGFIQDQADEDKDADADEEFDNSDDSVDETAEEADGPGAFMEWIADMALSKKLKEDVDFPKFTTNLAIEFLKCSKYKFAGIVERTSPITPLASAQAPISASNGVNTLDVIEYNEFALLLPLVERVEVQGYDSNGDPVGLPHSEYIEVYPYSLCPVFAFKYFEYDVASLNYDVIYPFDNTLDCNSCDPKFEDFPTDYHEDFKVFKTIKQLELSFCYNDLNLPAGVNLCYPPPCSVDNRDHFDWTCEERSHFYMAIKGFQQIDPSSFADAIPQATESCEDYFNGVAPNVFSPQDTPSYSGTATTFEDWKFDIFYNACNSGCEDRRMAITNNIVAMFLENCYEVEPLDCPVDDNVILMSEIDAIVENIIQECKSECNAIRVDAQSNTAPDFYDYPNIVTDYCFSFNASAYINATDPNDTHVANGFTVPIWLDYNKNCKLELGAQCHLDKVFQLKYWNIEIDINKHYCDEDPLNVTANTKPGYNGVEPENQENQPIWWNNTENCSNSPTIASPSNGYTQSYGITIP